MNIFIEDSHAAFVNLDRRVDRLTRMQTSLKEVGITAARVRGLLPAEYSGPPSRIACMARRPQKGAIGCYFSQLGIIKEAYFQKKHAFVMEDDLVFCKDFMVRMEYVNRFIQTHPWDVIWLGGTFHVNPPWWHKEDLGRDAEVTDDPRIIRTFGAFSTHAYIVNHASIAKIMPWLDELLPYSMGIDWSFIQIQPALYTYAFVPGCVVQYDNQSDIGHGVTKFSGFARLGPYWFQDRLDMFDPVSYDWHEAGHRHNPLCLYPRKSYATI